MRLENERTALLNLRRFGILPVGRHETLWLENVGANDQRLDEWFDERLAEHSQTVASEE